MTTAVAAMSAAVLVDGSAFSGGWAAAACVVGGNEEEALTIRNGVVRDCAAAEALALLAGMRVSRRTLYVKENVLMLCRSSK